MWINIRGRLINLNNIIRIAVNDTEKGYLLQFNALEGDINFLYYTRENAEEVKNQIESFTKAIKIIE